MKERLFLLRKSLKLNQEDFGARIELSKATISALEKGLREITDRTVKLICNEFNVNEEWFRIGEGEMFVEDDSTIISNLSAQYNLDSLDREILELYLKLSPTERKTIKQFALSMGKLASKSMGKEVDIEKKQNPMTENQTEELDEEAQRELELYKMELLDEKKGKTSSVS